MLYDSKCFHVIVVTILELALERDIFLESTVYQYAFSVKVVH